MSIENQDKNLGATAADRETEQGFTPMPEVEYIVEPFIKDFLALVPLPYTQLIMIRQLVEMIASTAYQQGAINGIKEERARWRDALKPASDTNSANSDETLHGQANDTK